MTDQCMSPATVRILATVPVDRLQRAVNALVDTGLTVMLTRQTEAEIRALVKNGTKEYGVTRLGADSDAVASHSPSAAQSQLRARRCVNGSARGTRTAYNDSRLDTCLP